MYFAKNAYHSFTVGFRNIKRNLRMIFENFSREWGLWPMLSDLRRGADGGSCTMPKSPSAGWVFGPGGW